MRVRLSPRALAGDALPEVAKVRPGLYVTLTDGSAVQITVEHIPARDVRPYRSQYPSRSSTTSNAHSRGTSG